MPSAGPEGAGGGGGADRSQESSEEWAGRIEDCFWLLQTADRPCAPCPLLVTGTDPEEGAADTLEYTGYSAAFAPLHNAAVSPADPLPDIPDARQYLAASLARFSQVTAGPFTTVAILMRVRIYQPCKPASRK